jgi:hypothetical protein
MRGAGTMIATEDGMTMMVVETRDRTIGTGIGIQTEVLAVSVATITVTITEIGGGRERSTTDGIAQGTGTVGMSAVTCVIVETEIDDPKRIALAIFA